MTGICTSYKVAATGMRVEKTTNNQTTRFVYGMNRQLLYERNLGTNQRSHYLYLDGQPVGLVRNGTLYYVLPDHLGRPEVIVNQNQDQVWRANLTAFERRVVRDQIGGYALGFPGQYHDPETGFAYNVHRDYDPATGRYIQSDPIGLAGGLNTYSYAQNNPVSFIDPLGLDVYLCRQPAQIPGMGFVEHHWIRTDAMEAGMGGTRGHIPGNEKGDKPYDRVEVVPHPNRHKEPGATCEKVSNIDESRVNQLLQPGRSLGLWNPWNQCQSFSASVIREASTVPYILRPEWNRPRWGF